MRSLFILRDCFVVVSANR